MPMASTIPQSAGGDGVLDLQLRVRGIQLLRVADASAFPRIPSGPTQATAMAVGHRAAELVAEDSERRHKKTNH